MGAIIGWGMNTFCPERLRSLVAGGQGAKEDDPAKPNPEKERRIAAFRQGHAALIARREKAAGPKWRPEMRDRLLAADLDALIAALSLGEYVGLEEAARRAAVPCLVYAGENDPYYEHAKGTAEFTPGAAFVSLPGLDHGNTFLRSDLVLPHVLRFLASVEA